MPRSGIEARIRLRQAALDLFTQHGYDTTTTAQIAERAGVTERTYFRHFADKREVLFDGESELIELIVRAIADAPVGSTPLQLVAGAYTATVPLLVKNRPVAERRAAVIVGTPALEERAHSKSAALAEAVVESLVERGIAEPTARLTAQVGAAMFSHASRAWNGDPKRDLAALIAQAADEVRSLG